MSNKITLDSRLQEDLDITGDDAYELIVNYGEKFNVDISRFMASFYFAGEGDMFWRLFRFLTKNKRTHKELTIGHLLKGIKYKRLDEEVIKDLV